MKRQRLVQEVPHEDPPEDECVEPLYLPSSPDSIPEARSYMEIE